ncbi:MAG: aminotransferase class V-fold PLP-dependent enzyme [Geodermatophilaceae bacterium]
MSDALDAWRRGRAEPEAYDALVTRSRVAFARLVNAPPETVAIGATASGLIGQVAASLSADAEVLTADGDFTSLLFPFLAQEPRGVTVRSVPLAQLAEQIRPTTSLVAVSAVQSSNGAVVDFAALRSAADEHGARVLLDATQAAGWLPLRAPDWEYVVVAAFKWLCCLRGAAFMAVQREVLDEIVPHSASWYAGEDIWSAVYGGPLRLAKDARRLDSPPAWLSYVGAAPALELLADVGVEAIHRYDVEIANAFRAGLDLPAGDSAIVSLPLDADATARLTTAGVRTAGRAGATRFSFHLYTDLSDVNSAVAAIRG